MAQMWFEFKLYDFNVSVRFLQNCPLYFDWNSFGKSAVLVYA